MSHNRAFIALFLCSFWSAGAALPAAGQSRFGQILDAKLDADGNPAIAKVSRAVYEHFARLARSSEIGRVVSDK